MLHKRKIIKKARAAQKINSILEQTEVQSHQSILEKLKSSNPVLKQQAITILSNIHFCMPELTTPEFIRQLIGLLYQSHNSIVYQTIFGLSNLCEIQPSLIGKLFDNGLDKALLQLSSTDKQLLKPILIFFITVADHLPKKYIYLVQGVQKSLSIDHLKHNTQLCLQFLFRTLNLAQMTEQISQGLLKQIASVFRQSYSMNEKSYSVAILAQSLQSQGKWGNQIQQILLNYMTELLVCTDLQNQYKMNIGQQSKQKPAKNQDEDLLQNQQQQQQMEQQQQINTAHIKSPNEKQLKKQQMLKRKQKLKFFMNTIQGTEILLEFILDSLESQDPESQLQSSDQQQIEQVQQAPSQGMNCQSQLKSEPKFSSLKPLLLSFIQQNMSIFPKFLCLSSSVVPQTENIVYLFYHLLTHVDKELALSTTNNQNIIEVNQLIQMSLENLFSSVDQKQNSNSDLSIEQYEILVQCLEIGLKILLKNKALGVTEKFLVDFSKCYMIKNQIFTSFKLVEQIKPAWLVMLELYSKVLNPEINKNITPQQNYQLGKVLRHLLVSIPYTEVQEFRCQVIDTLFDVYSNQNFDKSFVDLGFFTLLQTVLKQSNNSNKKQTKISKSKGNKKQRFVNQVLKDVKRFLQYKHKMIKI